MKQLFFSIIWLLAYATSTAQENSRINATLIPAPVEATFGQGSFSISQHTIIKAAKEWEREASFLSDFVKGYTGFALPVSNNTGRNFIQIRVDPILVHEPEGYLLRVHAQGISLTGHDGAGLLHGIQSLRQLWKAGTTGQLTIPYCTIKDYPRFGYRGMHFDVSRHFFSVSFVKKFIDILSIYKLNTFHWHLTDDQGWRIEIKKYPLLQSIAAYREETMIGHKKELPHRFDGKRYGGYYTQEQIKEVVQYAAERHINIIPEIEMPGHALAALSAYPSLGCTGGPYKAATFWGIFDDVFCAGKDSVFVFMQNVLDEVITLFPSAYIHVGGDECPKTRWKTCPDCQRRIKENGLADEDALQSYFIRRISDHLTKRGRHLIGWDEILEGGLAPGATVMSWRGIDGAIEAAKQQHHVIMTPEYEFYYDHYQSLYPSEPVGAGGYTPLSKVYAFKPLPDSADPKLLPYITGVQGQLWSEYLPTTRQAEYMLLPRMIAMAEVAWSPEKGREYDNFLRRLRAQKNFLARIPVHPAANFDEINYRVKEVLKGKVIVTLQSSLPGARIYYSTDGSTPGIKSSLYNGPITIDRSGVLKAVLYQQGKLTGRIFEQTFSIHKATGVAVSLKQQPTGRFGGNGSQLVNGIFGVHRFNDQQWMGFSGIDLEAVLDLGSVQTIKEVGANILSYQWQRMRPPVSLQFFVSNDGVQYTLVAEEKNFPINGINAVRVGVKDAQARYLKVTGKNSGIIPPGGYGAGNNSLLMIDEVIVH